MEGTGPSYSRRGASSAPRTLVLLLLATLLRARISSSHLLGLPPGSPPVDDDYDGPFATFEERTVHFIWGMWDDGELPTAWAVNMARWTALNPMWRTRLWLRSSCEELVNMTGVPAEWRDAYWSARPIQRADLVRLMIVYAHGGMYADLDARTAGS